MALTFLAPLKLEHELLRAPLKGVLKRVVTVGDVPDTARDMLSICSGH